MSNSGPAVRAEALGVKRRDFIVAARAARHGDLQRKDPDDER